MVSNFASYIFHFGFHYLMIDFPSVNTSIPFLIDSCSCRLVSGLPKCSAVHPILNAQYGFRTDGNHIASMTILLFMAVW